MTMFDEFDVFLFEKQSSNNMQLFRFLKKWKKNSVFFAKVSFFVAFDKSLLYNESWKGVFSLFPLKSSLCIRSSIILSFANKWWPLIHNNRNKSIKMYGNKSTIDCNRNVICFFVKILENENAWWKSNKSLSRDIAIMSCLWFGQVFTYSVHRILTPIWTKIKLFFCWQQVFRFSIVIAQQTYGCTGIKWST